MKKLIIMLMFASISGMAQEFATLEDRKIMNDFIKENLGKQYGDGICRTLIDSAVYKYSGVNNMSELMLYLDGNGLMKYRITTYDSIKNLDVIAYINLHYIVSQDSVNVEFEDEPVNHIVFARRFLGGEKVKIADQNPFYVSNRDEDFSKYISLKDEKGFDDGALYVVRLPNKEELIKIAKKTDRIKNNLLTLQKNK